MIPRPYQYEALYRVDEAFTQYQSTLVEMATGLGKTTVFAFIADAWPAKVLVLAHRKELITQAAEEIQAVTGKECAIEMAKRRAKDMPQAKVTVATVQTLSSENRLAEFKPHQFGLIVIDEGHHAPAATYRTVLDYFPAAKRLFVTATPKRADKLALGAVCESVAFQYGIERAIEDGWLVPIVQKVVQVEGLDFSKAKAQSGDFSEEELESVLMQEKPLHQMVASGHEIVGKRQTLWFCASVAHARACAAVLRRYVGERAVAFLEGETPTHEREVVVRDYKEGRIQHLFNCGLFLEGFNAPSTSAVVMARPTKSLALYTQILGRGTRPLPGTVDGIETALGRRQSIAGSSKPDMIPLDYVCNSGRHRIIQAVDVLSGRYDLPTRDYALKTAQEEGGTGDIEKALERAKEEMALEAEEQRRRARIKATSVQYQTHEISPFTKRYNGAERVDAPKPVKEMCSEKQARYIMHLDGGRDWSLADAMSLTKDQARGVIGKLKKQYGYAEVG